MRSTVALLMLAFFLVSFTAFANGRQGVETFDCAITGAIPEEFKEINLCAFATLVHGDTKSRTLILYANSSTASKVISESVGTETLIKNIFKIWRTGLDVGTGACMKVFDDDGGVHLATVTSPLLKGTVVEYPLGWMIEKND